MNKLTDRGSFQFDSVVGTGAIGSGMLLFLEGDHTLGRNESRAGVLSSAKDFAKLHIILHYIAIFLTGNPKSVGVYPVSCVGNDDIGKQLINEMKKAGMSLDGVSITSGAPTMFSVCFQYPDSTGGNITTSQSASNYITKEDISSFVQHFPSNERLLMLSAPEAPLEARIQLLLEGRERAAYNVASILSSEVSDFIQMGGVELTDLLALNIDEARAICKDRDLTVPSPHIVESCAQVLSQHNPGIVLSVTDGPNGSFLWEGGRLEQIPALSAKVESTAGAGDAYLSGMIVGLCRGLPLSKGRSDSFFSEMPLKTAVELGVLFSSFAVHSIDSIHLGANKESLRNYIRDRKLVCEDNFLEVFE